MNRMAGTRRLGRSRERSSGVFLHKRVTIRKRGCTLVVYVYVAMLVLCWVCEMDGWVGGWVAWCPFGYCWWQKGGREMSPTQKGGRGGG